MKREAENLQETRDAATGWAACARRLLLEDSGNDVIEYGLLATFIGIVAIVLMGLGDEILVVYQSWDGSVQNLWEPRNPGQ